MFFLLVLLLLLIIGKDILAFCSSVNDRNHEINGLNDIEFSLMQKSRRRVLAVVMLPSARDAGSLYLIYLLCITPFLRHLHGPSWLLWRQPSCLIPARRKKERGEVIALFLPGNCIPPSHTNYNATTSVTHLAAREMEKWLRCPAKSFITMLTAGQWERTLESGFALDDAAQRKPCFFSNGNTA